MAESSVRLDKWLWAARIFKTRAIAVAAIAGGKVQVNGARAKRAKSLKVGGRIRVRHGPYEYQLTVRALSERRGPAAAAALLSEEDPDGRRARDGVGGGVWRPPRTAPRARPCERAFSRWTRGSRRRYAARRPRRRRPPRDGERDGARPGAGTDDRPKPPRRTRGLHPLHLRARRPGGARQPRRADSSGARDPLRTPGGPGVPPGVLRR